VQKNKTKKENLILVHSFPTNSIVLAGLVEFLDDYFHVYFIDLPGFTKKTPLEKGRISLASYSKYLSEKIKEFNLDSYIIGGISFGFVVVNNMKPDAKKCKAILAIEPYLNNKFVHMSLFQRFLYAYFFTGRVMPKISKKFWESPHAEQLFGYVLGRHNKLTTIVAEVDARTFFDTAKILFKNSKKVTFHTRIPYVLWINKHDTTINADKIVAEFEKNVPRLLVKYNDVDHYPRDMSKRYFKSKIKEKDIMDSIAWINSCYS